MAKNTLKNASTGIEQLRAALLGAAPKDICNLGKIGIEKGDVPSLLRLYKLHVDYCFDNDFPSKQMLLDNASKEQLNSVGFYIDQKADVKNVPSIIALGESELNLNVDGYSVCEVYAKNSSILNIKASGSSFVMVDVFNDVVLKAGATENAIITVNVYGNANVEASGNVKVIEKGRDRY